MGNNGVVCFAFCCFLLDFRYGVLVISSTGRCERMCSRQVSGTLRYSGFCIVSDGLNWLFGSTSDIL